MDRPELDVQETCEVYGGKELENGEKEAEVKMTFVLIRPIEKRLTVHPSCGGRAAGRTRGPAG